MISNTTMVGTIAFDFELKNPNSDGKEVVRFDVNVSRNYKKEDEKYYPTDKFICKAFGKTAVSIANRYRKGDVVVVTGRFILEKYSMANQQTGQQEEKSEWVLTVNSSFDIVGPLQFIKRDGAATNTTPTPAHTTPIPANSLPKASIPVTSQTAKTVTPVMNIPGLKR